MMINGHDRVPRAAALLVLTAAAAAGSEMDAAQVLIDFAAEDGREWFAVDDGVMGGLSRSGMRRTGRGTGLFAGTVSLANNGGFASVRTLFGPTDIRGADGLELRVRGDGRRYQLRLRSDERFDGVAYAAGFGTVAGEWTDVRLPLADFRPTFRGRPVPDAPPFDPSALRQLTFMITGKQAGDFALEIAAVRTWTAADAR